MWSGGLDGQSPSPLSLPVSQVPAGEEVYECDINFDRALPGLHKYLGDDFVEVTGRTYLEAGTEIQMFAFYRSGVILVPGQSLPLIPYGPFESNLLQKINREKLPLIFLPGCFDHYTALDDLIDCVGTTADLIAIRIPDDEEYGTIHAIFVGRQRIRIAKVARDDNYPLVCHGTILPETSTNHSMATHSLGWGLLPRSWCRFGLDPPATKQKLPEAEHIPPVSAVTRIRRLAHRRSRHSQSSSSSSQPPLPSTNPISLVPPGNPLSIFDSRLSTWRHFGPLNSGSVSPLPTSGVSPRLDHFIDDTVPHASDSAVMSHTSTPDLSPSAGAPSRPITDRASESGSDSTTDSRSSYHTPTGECPSEALEGAPSQPDIIVEDVELIMDRAVDRDGRPFRYRIQQPCHPRLLARRDMLAAAAQCFASLPFWVYRQYDLNYLVTAIQAELFSWNDTWHVDRFRPELAVPFSYWLVQNLPMPGQLKAYILGIDHVVQRLRALLDVIRRSAACVCGLCDANITSNRYIICLAQEGSFQTYVNAAGVLHDMVTVSQITQSSVTLVGSPSEEYSWFPGYAWTIANCAGCSRHLGWLFTAVKEDLRPRRFWGIRRDSIVPGLINSSDWRPCV
ncbi:Cereblon [Fasciola gigantica]|uniref:Cereblon n=1 Tax=Fasciola gigantica TaxID=46835 RepID=A0A504Y922_FASGI|nr:Cereblon [Fasciola gigantica]